MSAKEVIALLEALPNDEKGEVMDWLEEWELEQDAKLAEEVRLRNGPEDYIPWAKAKELLDALPD